MTYVTTAVLKDYIDKLAEIMWDDGEDISSLNTVKYIAERMLRDVTNRLKEIEQGQ